jgi:hypothetical protein
MILLAPEGCCAAGHPEGSIRRDNYLHREPCTPHAPTPLLSLSHGLHARLSPTNSSRSVSRPNTPGLPHGPPTARLLLPQVDTAVRALRRRCSAASLPKHPISPKFGFVLHTGSCSSGRVGCAHHHLPRQIGFVFAQANPEFFSHNYLSFRQLASDLPRRKLALFCTIALRPGLAAHQPAPIPGRAGRIGFVLHARHPGFTAFRPAARCKRPTARTRRCARHTHTPAAPKRKNSRPNGLESSPRQKQAGTSRPLSASETRGQDLQFSSHASPQNQRFPGHARAPDLPACLVRIRYSVA